MYHITIERRENWIKIFIKNTYYWYDFFSFVSPSGDFTGHLRFWLQEYLVQNWLELFTRKKLTIIINRTLWSCHSESGKWKFERTVTLMEDDRKQMCIILNEGYIELITWREIALVQYNSWCEFTHIDLVREECNMSCSEKKRGFADCECFALKEKELNLIN